MVYIRVKCAGCSAVIFVPHEELPGGMRIGEFVERDCGRCGEFTCMTLVEPDEDLPERHGKKKGR